MTSCEADDNGYKPDPIDAGAYARLQDRSISLLDQSSDLTIELFSDGNVSVESMVIEDADGVQIATANVAGETATFNSSDLGDFLFEDENEELTELTGSFPITMVSTLTNGMVLRDPASVSVGHAISLGGLDEVVFMDPTSEEDDEDVSSILEYSLSTHSAVVDDFYLEYKVGEDGTYQPVEDIELSQNGGEIDFSDLHYLDYGIEQGETLYYRFTATSGELEDVVETSIDFIPQAFGESVSGSFTNDASGSQFNFASGLNFAEESLDGEVVFTGDAGIEAVNDAQIEFVDVTGEGISIGDGAWTAYEAFEDASASSSVSNLQNGDVLVYRVTRQEGAEEGETAEEVVHYGVIEIGTVSVADGDNTNIAFDYAEGAVRGVETGAEAPEEPGEEPEEPGDGSEG